MKKGRFKQVYYDNRDFGKTERILDTILRDEVTGVLYLQSRHTRGLSITPLLDKDGKPLTNLNK